MALPDSAPSLYVVPAQDRPGLLVQFEHGPVPVCRPLPSFGPRRGDEVRLGVFLEGRHIIHAPLAPRVWEELVLAGWLEHPLKLVLHVATEGPYCLVGQWYLVGGIRAPALEGEADAEGTGWLPRMLTFPQVYSRVRAPLVGPAALRAGAARLAMDLAYGIGSDIALGDLDSA